MPEKGLGRKEEKKKGQTDHTKEHKEKHREYLAPEGRKDKRDTVRICAIYFQAKVQFDSPFQWQLAMSSTKLTFRFPLSPFLKMLMKARFTLLPLPLSSKLLYWGINSTTDPAFSLTVGLPIFPSTKNPPLTTWEEGRGYCKHDCIVSTFHST